MSESTVWAALRLLRDTPGSPVLRIARGTGQLPDRYALTTPMTVGTPSDRALARAHVTPVHQAWSMLGLRARGLYDLIRSDQVSAVKDALAAARMGSSAGYAALADLRVAGLISMHKGALATTNRSLDDVAADSGLDQVANERMVRHRAERLLWHAWLETRSGPAPPDRNDAADRDFAPAIPAALVLDMRESEAMWAATMAAGPPSADPLLDA